MTNSQSNNVTKVAQGTVTAVKGAGNLVGTIIKVGLQGIGAGLAVGKAAYDEAKEGYRTTDTRLSTPRPQATRKPQAVKREPQQMDMFEPSDSSPFDQI